MPKVSDDHRRARREQILAAAHELFAEQGFAGTSMAQIVTASGLSTGAVYRYFDGKDALIVATCERGTATLDRLFAAQPSARAAVGSILDSAEGADLRFGIQVWGEAMRDPRIAEIVARSHRLLATRLAERIEADRSAARATGVIGSRDAADLVLSALGGYRERVAIGLRFDRDQVRRGLEAILALAGA